MTLNIAHRGYSGKYDENTMMAFIKAIEFNADGIETDVQLTKDNIPVIIHDETIDRTTNGSGFVKDYSFNEIQKFKTANGEKIPRLEDLLEIFKKSNLKLLNLELKNSIINYEGLEKIVLGLVKKYNIEDKVIISSFNHYSVLKVKELNPKIKVGALTETTLVNVTKYLKEINCECYHPYYYSICNEKIMKDLLDNNIEVNPYTVNNKEDMQRLINLGVTGIITNEIETLNELLSENER